jgi:hypothetical protein
LTRIRSAAAQVEKAARALGIDPKGIVHTRVPGFDALAEQLQIYGDRYGVEDLVGSVPESIPLSGVPEEARQIQKNDYVVYHLSYMGVKGPHILRVDEVDVQMQISGRRKGDPPVLVSGLIALAAQPEAGHKGLLSGALVRDVRFTRMPLPYSTYEKEWEKLNEAKPSFIGFMAFGKPGMGGQVQIDLDNLAGPGRSQSTEADDIKMGLGGKYIERGHLVAHVFQGPDIYSDGNIVAMTYKANHNVQTGMWSIEKPVLDDIKTNFAVYKYKANPYPVGSTEQPPKKIEVTAERLFPSTPIPPGIPRSKIVKNE